MVQSCRFQTLYIRRLGSLYNRSPHTLRTSCIFTPSKWFPADTFEPKTSFDAHTLYLQGWYLSWSGVKRHLISMSQPWQIVGAIEIPSLSICFTGYCTASFIGAHKVLTANTIHKHTPPSGAWIYLSALSVDTHPGGEAFSSVRTAHEKPFSLACAQVFLTRKRKQRWHKRDRFKYSDNIQQTKSVMTTRQIFEGGCREEMLLRT